MSQLYARVFLQILDSSIAEDFTVRHVFEDFLKLSEDGIVDMTRQSLSRRINCPIEVLNKAIAKLESPDASSRDEAFGGRRLERLDDHRDWGWQILNWGKYEAMRTRADVAIRVRRHRDKKKNGNKEPAPEPAQPRLKHPTLDEVKLAAAKAGLPDSEAEKFFHHYESNGWKIGGKAPMKSLPSTIAGWTTRWRERIEKEKNETNQRTTVRRENRNDGTYNAKTEYDYNAAMVRTPKGVPDAPGQGTGENAGSGGTVAG